MLLVAAITDAAISRYEMASFLVGVDAQLADRLVDYRGFELAVEVELVERGDGDEAGIHFEEIAQRRFGLRCGRSRRCPATPCGAASTC